MIVSREREKLVNAIIYFVANTRHCHTLKLFKLLNFLDSEHYRQTGLTVTGLTYTAFPKGPVPRDLYQEIKRNGDADLRAAVSLIPVKDDLTEQLLRRDLKPRKAFDPKHFTKRELVILERIAEFFAELRAEDMSEFSHLKGLPWNAVYAGGKGNGRDIPNELSLNFYPLVHDKERIGDEELQYRQKLREGL